MPETEPEYVYRVDDGRTKNKRERVGPVSLHRLVSMLTSWRYERHLWPATNLNITVERAEVGPWEKVELTEDLHLKVE